MIESVRSIRLRLLLAAILTLLIAMTAAGWGLLVMFEHHVERRTVDALRADLGELIAGVAVANDGTVELARRPTDPRYLKPLSGSYWQVIADDEIVQRSRSLWDETLSITRDNLEDGYHERIVRGPQAQTLIGVERSIQVSRPAGTIQVRFVAAQDRADIIAAVANFRVELILMLLLLGASLLAAFAIAIAVGLAPLRRLRADLAALRSGAKSRLASSYPVEVGLLVSDLNALLDERDKDAERKRQRAADLAHGLKTPLTAISGISEDLSARGLGGLANELDSYTASMLRHVERELALARSIHISPGTPATPVRQVIDALVRSLARAPGGCDLEWEVDVPNTLSLRIDETALAEILGGPLDNARKHAASRVSVRAFTEAGYVSIRIEDDGKGVCEDKLASLGKRGQRLDSREPGSGLGLAIASDIADEIGGNLTLSNASTGGFQVTLTLPPALARSSGD